MEKTTDKKSQAEDMLALFNQCRECRLSLEECECIVDLQNQFNQVLKEQHPPMNKDAVEKKLQNHVTAYLTAPPSWSKQEQESFLEIIRKNAQEIVLKPFELKVDFLIEKTTKKLSPGDQIKTSAEIHLIHETMQALRIKPLALLWETENIKLDWLKISADMLDKSYDRSPESCKLMWENYLIDGSSINKKGFTEEEDRELARLVKLHDACNWHQIAESLQTNRTPLECFKRFKRTLNKRVSKKFWTYEDDQKLIEAVELCRVRDIIPWKKVLQFMNGWTVLQLQYRWDRCLKPQNRESSWTPQEDAILLLCVHFMGYAWKMISDFLHGRSNYICRERYTKVLDPLLHTGDWTWSEDLQLLTLLSSYGEKWGSISRHLSGRTHKMINHRCNVLKRCKPDLYDKVLKSKGEDLQMILPKKQFARTYNCKNINSKKENIRAMALDCAKSAVQKVRGSICDVSECKTFKDLADKINFSTLKEVSCILLPKGLESLIKRPKLNHRFENSKKMEQETEDADDLFLTDAEKEQSEEWEDQEVENENPKALMTLEEIHTLDNNFCDLIFPISVWGCEKAFVFKNRKMEIEYNLLCTYLIKAFNLKNAEKVCASDDSSDEEDTVLFKSIDFSKTLTRIIEMFIFAASKDKSFVLPISMTNIKSFVMILLMRRNLRSILTTLPSEKLNKVDLILESRESPQNCCRCFAIQQTEIYSAVNNQCSAGIVCIECANAGCIKNRLTILRKRFMSTFCYCAFLTIYMPSEIQIQEFVMKNLRPLF